MNKKISQLEARRLKRRVDELEANERRRNNAWSGDFPGGVHVYTLTIGDALRQTIRVSRQLGHAVVVTLSSDGSAQFHACKLQSSRMQS